VNCFNAARHARWQNRKITLAKQLGGRCKQCGWEPVERREWAALDFHHRDPATKEMAIAGNWLLSRKAAAEALKCDLLCANCHRIHHAHMWAQVA
jgi:hypothetical protein